MKTRFKGFAAALLLAASQLPVHAEDKPAATAAPSAAAPADAKPGDAKPAVVPRPSIAPKSTGPKSTEPKSTEPKSTDKATEAAPGTSREPAPRRHRRIRRYASWQTFPIYLPHLSRHRIVWNRVHWF